MQNTIETSRDRENLRGYILCSFSFVSVCFVGGVVYGWPSLRRELIEDGSALSEQQLGAAFTVGAWSTQGCRFLTGMARDRFGTRLVTAFCIAASAMGFLGIAVLDVNNISTLCVSMFVMGIGSGAQLCVQPVASLFPSVAGSILASLSGAFQISGLVFLALTATQNRLVSFASFCAILLVLAIIAFALLPQGASFLEDEKPQGDEIQEQTERTAGEIVKVESGNDCENDANEESKVAPSDLIDPEKPDADENETSTGGAEEVEDKKFETAMQQILSIEYILLVGWFSILIVPMQYFVGSLGFQLEEKGDETSFYSNLFSILYGSSSVLAPAIGYLADRVGVGIVQALSTTLVSVSFFILATDAPLNIQAIGLGCNGMGRMFVYGMFFTHIGKRLGYRNYGTLAGLGLLISAVASILQYPLIAAAADGQARAVNIACGSMLICTLPYCIWLARRERQ